MERGAATEVEPPGTLALLELDRAIDHAVGEEFIVSVAQLARGFRVSSRTEAMGKLEALRSAQVAMLKKNRIEHGAPLPSTWGAFVLSGNWR